MFNIPILEGTAPYGNLLLAPAECWWPLATWRALRALWIAVWRAVLAETTSVWIAVMLWRVHICRVLIAALESLAHCCHALERPHQSPKPELVWSRCKKHDGGTEGRRGGEGGEGRRGGEGGEGRRRGGGGGGDQLGFGALIFTFNKGNPIFSKNLGTFVCFRFSYIFIYLILGPSSIIFI